MYTYIYYITCFTTYSTLYTLPSLIFDIHLCTSIYRSY